MEDLNKKARESFLEEVDDFVQQLGKNKIQIENLEQLKETLKEI